PGFSRTKTGDTHGTPEFMAPEQAMGQRSMINARTDVYACGATMFALLTGKTSHEAETPQLLMMRVAMEPARHVQMVRPDLPESVATVADGALESDQKDRSPDAAAMLVEVRQTLAELRQVAQSVSPAEPAEVPAPRSVESTAPPASSRPGPVRK